MLTFLGEAFVFETLFLERFCSQVTFWGNLVIFEILRIVFGDFWIHQMLEVKFLLRLFTSLSLSSIGCFPKVLIPSLQETHRNPSKNP